MTRVTRKLRWSKVAQSSVAPRRTVGRGSPSDGSINPVRLSAAVAARMTRTTHAPRRSQRRRASCRSIRSGSEEGKPTPPGVTALPRAAQLERVVHDLERLGGLFLVDDATDLDLAGGDVLDVHLRVGQGLEHA